MVGFNLKFHAQLRKRALRPALYDVISLSTNGSQASVGFENFQSQHSHDQSYSNIRIVPVSSFPSSQKRYLRVHVVAQGTRE